MRPRQIILAIAVTLALSTSLTNAADFTLKLDYDGKTLEGTPVSWTKRKVLFLERDGFLHEIDPYKTSNISKTKQRFQSLSQAKMRHELQHEFGRRFDVSGTGHYLVVHPAGQRDLWAQRFEDLYRSMMHYFAARGIRVNKPQFPLVAVVFPTQQQFQDHTAEQLGRLPPGILGLYVHNSNRVFMYDIPTRSGSNWMLNREVIVHEAAHQSAFNIGVHSRYTPPPRWLSEGLGTLFEARGVYDSQRYRNLSDRINQERLAMFQRSLTDPFPEGAVATMASTDEFFWRYPDQAYALAWAMTFMYAEREPAKLASYLKKTASRKPLEKYTSVERVKDFVSVFGNDFDAIERRLVRYMSTLAKVK